MSILPKAEYLEHHMHQLGWVKVTYCKDCKHCYRTGGNVKHNVCHLGHAEGQADDWHCADGENK